MGLVLKNRIIAEQFLKEFEEMYRFKDEAYIGNPKLLVGLNGRPEIPVGHFHTDKRPNTQRYFKFKDDGTEVRLHFSPTDDAEHRVLIPLLLSAKEGDEIRVSAFGGGGFEFVRAFQWAVAQGAHVKIVFDSLTGACGISTWITDRTLNLLSTNPYSSNPKGKLQVQVDSWPGMNHQKIASLTHIKDGKTHVETLVVGSQNWTRPGNDANDENEITIRNRHQDVIAGREFNEHFDRELWVHSRPLETIDLVKECKSDFVCDEEG